MLIPLKPREGQVAIDWSKRVRKKHRADVSLWNKGLRKAGKKKKAKKRKKVSTEDVRLAILALENQELKEYVTKEGVRMWLRCDYRRKTAKRMRRLRIDNPKSARKQPEPVASPDKVPALRPFRGRIIEVDWKPRATK